jgi:putative tryptophan/tyrosine transport system substrate-binding protein
LVPIESRGPVDIGEALSRYTNHAVGGLLLVGDSTLAGDSGVRAQASQFTREHRLPSASFITRYARDGGLLSLGTDKASIFRRAGEYVHRIIHGMRPSDLPFENPTKFELVINLKTAKALGPTIPPSLLARANEIID